MPCKRSPKPSHDPTITYDSGDANTSAIASTAAPEDPLLARLRTAWDSLTPAQREALVAVAEASGSLSTR
jgi:hypothetical protein